MSLSNRTTYGATSSFSQRLLYYRPGPCTDSRHRWHHFLPFHAEEISFARFTRGICVMTSPDSDLFMPEGMNQLQAELGNIFSNRDQNVPNHNVNLCNDQACIVGGTIVEY